jgi:hypothetical protein
MLSRRLVFPLLAALTLGACTYPGYVSGTAPTYPSGYQPVMGGRAAFWPQQPGALWGPEDVPGIDVFYQPLGQYGRWAQSRWGQVFVPAAPAGWRPYQNGQWLENRFWLSADPWGWATDHYGRWGFDNQLGWVWVPGTQWGPSWVAWREADEVVGWAPIPPQVQWNVGIGFGSGWGYDNWSSWYGPSWLWVPRNSLFVSGFGGRLLPWNSGLTWWGRSRWQHSPYWGWNQPWDSGWGWQVPPSAWNNWAGGHPGWSNWGWNRPNWQRPGWGGWNDGGWNHNGNRPPRRGQPGSVGDRIGRDITGQPPAGWQGDGRRPERQGDGWRNDGNRWDGNRWDGNRWDGRRWDGNRRGGMNGPRPDGWNNGANPPRQGWNGANRPPASVSGRIGEAMGGGYGGNRGSTVQAPPPAAAPAARAAPQPGYQPRPPSYRPPPPPEPPPARNSDQPGRNPY